MRKNEVHLHYALLMLRGHNYHLLTTNYKELQPGNATSDFMGYFGMGAGEMMSARIDGLTMPITMVDVPDTELSLLMWKDNPRFIGFVDARPEFPIKIVLSGGKDSVYDLPINWKVYTRLGVPALAYQHLGAFRRAWVAYDTPEENYERVTDFMRLVQLFG